MDNATGNGGGAQSIADGQDCYGATCMPGVGLNSIETNEALQPALYLWRRLVPNSGGPGIFRGGQGLEIAFSIHDSAGLDGAMTLLVSEAPSQGTGGGFAGGTGSWGPTHPQTGSPQSWHSPIAKVPQEQTCVVPGVPCW